MAQYIHEQAEQRIITLTDAGVEDYLLEMCGAGWDEIEQMSKADLLLRCGGFERAETYTVAFATEGNTQYVTRNWLAWRIPLDGYTAVVDYVRASFLGGCVVLHCEAPNGTGTAEWDGHCQMERHCRTCGESTATTSRIRRVKRDGRARRAMRACRAAWWM